MHYKLCSKTAVCAVLAVSLTITSFGGAYAGTVLAASPEAEATEVAIVEKPQADSNKAILGGLVALGLIAALTGHKDKQVVSPSAQASTASASSALAKISQSQQNPVPVAVKQPTPMPSQPPTGQIKAAEQRAIDLLNADRRGNGLPALKMNGSLVVLAENYGQDMIQRNFFSHYNPEGQSPFDRMRNYGINYRYAGENLAINKSVDAAEKAFMNSPGHRANILNPNYSEVGVGVSYDSRGSVYVVQEFIGR